MLNQDFFNNLYSDLHQAPNGKKFLHKYGIIDANDLMIKLTTYRGRKEMYMDLGKNYALHQMHKQELDKFFKIPTVTSTVTEKKGTLEEVKPDFLDLDKDGDKTEPMKQAAEDSKLKNEIVANVLGKIKEVAVTVNYDDPSKQDDILNEPTAADATAAAKAYQTSPNFKGTVKDAQGKILVHRENLNEGMERDYEGQMAKAQLISIVKNARDLFNSIDDNTQLKAWIQSKLTKAEDYISSVRTYLDSESLTTTTPLVHNNEPVKDDEGAALNIGDVVKAADGKIYQVVFSYSEGKPFLTPFDLKRRKPTNLRERHYFDNVSEEMNKTLKMSKVMEYTATKGGFMR